MEIIENREFNSHQLKLFEGYLHGKWTYDQAQPIIRHSIDFLTHQFQKTAKTAQ